MSDWTDRNPENRKQDARLGVAVVVGLMLAVGAMGSLAIFSIMLR